MSSKNELKFRPYQTKGDRAITKHLKKNAKCLVKMFCGTGKSLLMRYCTVVKNAEFCVFVVPSLVLLEQFYKGYLGDFPSENTIRISSESESTTNVVKIREFFTQKADTKIMVFVTYQSFHLVIDNLQNRRPVCIFDEAHHVVGKVYQQKIFNLPETTCDKQVFFTATPKNANGITMINEYDDECDDHCSSMGHSIYGDCGKLVYNYTYLDGLHDNYLNPYNIVSGFYIGNTDDTTTNIPSIYECIARSILDTGNTRVLTFHADVSVDRDYSVKKFVDANQFIKVFRSVEKDTGILKSKFKKKITIKTMYAGTPKSERVNMLRELDECGEDEVYIIASCQTLGEGIDTKRANMCVFVDPKQSFVAITQNIGRIVRKQQGVSTVLIPCCVVADKYNDANTPELRDGAIRNDLNKDGNFSGILNVLCAIKQEDPELYKMCLYNRDTFSPREINNNFKRQGYKCEDKVGDGTLIETLNSLLDDDNKIDKGTNIEDVLHRVEIHTNSIETPVEICGNESSKTILRIYRTNEDSNVYLPIVATRKNAKKKVSTPPQGGIKFTSIINPDVQMLWHITDIAHTTTMGIDSVLRSCVLDCEVSYDEANWWNNLEKWEAFINEHGNTPNKRAEDKEEKFLGTWLGTQKNNYFADITECKLGMKDKKRHKAFTEFLEKYKEYFKDWWDNKKRAISFIEEHGKPTIGATDKEENFIASWISKNKGHYHPDITKCNEGVMNEERHKAFTEFLEKYKVYVMSDDEKWFVDLNKCIAFIKGNKIKPPEKSKDKDEKFLGCWLSHQNQNYSTDITKSKGGMKNEAKRNAFTEFLETYKEYFMSADKKWFNNLKKMIAFIEEHTRTPSQESKDKEEKFLGCWLSTNKKIYYKGGMDKDRHKAFTEFLEKYKVYVMSDDEKWFDNLDKLITFFEECERSPRAAGDNVSKEEKSLGCWLTNNKKIYSKGGMDKDRHKAFTEFLEKYKITIKRKKKKKTTDYVPPATASSNNTPVKNTKTDVVVNNKAELSILHQRYKTLRSDNLAKEFADSPDAWAHYHSVSEANESGFSEDEIPRNRICKYLDGCKTRHKKIVVDMGCGKAGISHYFKDDARYKFINYDHVAINSSVIAQDISQLPQDDGSADICILSLAMWGSNCESYVEEASRILESNGLLIIAEATKRWTDETDLTNIVPANRLIALLKNNGFTIKEKAINKFSLIVCVK
jgi:superfamily II DNA or RNA helicase